MANRQPVQNDEQVDLWIDQVSGIYHQLSLDLFDSMVDRLKARGAADLERNPYIWQLEKLNDMHMLNEENLELIAERSGIAKELLKRVIEHEGFKVYRTTKQQLAEDLKLGVTSMDYGVQFALSAYYTQAERELDSLINTTLPQSVRNNYEKIVVQSVAEVVTGTKTAEQALNDTLVKWFDNGFYGFTDARGKRWSADSYARTIIKSTTYRTYNEMRMRPAEELGIDTFYYSIKMCAREMCAPIQNRIVTTGVTRDIKGITVLSVMDYGYGTPAGCRGINCGHMMTPFIPGVNNMPELPDYLKGLTPEQAVVNAKAEAKQRSFERRIRKNKEKLHVAKKLGDKERVQKYKLREKTLKSGLKAFLDEHKFLHRDTSRERYRYDKESERIAIEKDFKERYNKFNNKLTHRVTEQQFKDLTSHNLELIKKVMQEHEEIGKRLQMKIAGEASQLTHILGSDEYKRRISDGENPSYFKEGTDLEALHRHMLKEMDMAKMFMHFQFINIGEFEGVHVFRKGERKSKKADQIKVHQAKDGVHGVPNRELKKGVK